MAVVASHLHWDRIGQVAIFKDLRTPIFVQKKELEYGLYMLWLGKGGYDYSVLASLRGANLVPIADEKFEIAEGVIVEFTGGHTPGHQVLHVTKETGTLVFLLDTLSTYLRKWSWRLKGGF